MLRQSASQQTSPDTQLSSTTCPSRRRVTRASTESLRYWLTMMVEASILLLIIQDHSGEGLLIDTINFVDQMIEEMVELNPNITDLWPSLGPLVAHNFSVLDQADLWPDKAEFTFVVIEQQRSFIGRQIILDFWRRNSSHIVVRRLPVDETAEHVVQFLEKLNISILPTVAVLNSQDQTVNILQSRNNEKSSLEKSIVDFIARKSLRTLPADGRLSSLSPAESTQQQDFIAEDDDIIRRRYTLYLNDLDKTVIFALNQEISLKQHLSDLEEKSLREFINILVKFYPSESEVYPKIIQIQNWLEQSEPHKVDLQRMSEIMESVADFAPHWLGCRGSQQTFGGYSCGVWSLWHFLTVAQLEAGQGQPRDVLRAMVSYLRHFFGCRECSDHFLQMVKNGTEIEREVTNYEEAVLFLWRKHNEVNLRLSGDASDDPVFPKGYFPSKRFCRECYVGDTEEETSSQRENIISFIKKHYSQHSLIRGGHFSTSFSLVSTLHNLLYIVEIIPLFFI